MTEVLREPRQDRSRATRQRLLEAAIECLAEVGWSGSTVSVVAERAGVSRGAAQHHFPTREDLFTSAVEHVTSERLAVLRSRAVDLPAGPDRTRAVVGMVELMYTGPLFRAAIHLWVAASSDERLKERVVGLEAQVGRETHRTALELLGVDESRTGVREAVQATLDMARGLGLANLLTDDRKRRQRVLDQWAAMLADALHQEP
ncbi:TetR/AcrR family transcriptional regulator [Actinophytocola algeriensis]|uniref:AcrR family transcriptional regulator n=1 Tax=Actinophytocola algeriensis TaxID=1768010 RepID=A0A7W7QAE0_9PSEU|nr:TetR/AcrR family transcriptional regulator [Actinophytocola algeriensis]MBB4910010.1 AcrR family transcriptional regulator [Actinophytocola algeriensis]MBE1476000.1 AcrR family transcriptional regulator [Actinophytocola algeriensis]